ncbi:MAG: hypothetical protein QOF74_8730 [Caballeronia mineralivorans]|jgi:hypothetical protein|nr:hypothetical protein [Caballeronia mineralivorans]
MVPVGRAGAPDPSESLGLAPRMGHKCESTRQANRLSAAWRAGLSMPLQERIQRHEALISRVRKHDVHWWC